MRRMALLLVFLLAPLGWGQSPSQELWVDAQGRPGGDGSRKWPLTELGQALRLATSRPSTVRLLSGLYRGPFELPPGLKLVGHGAVVLYAEGPAVLHAPGGGSLDSVWIQGAAVGLISAGQVRLRKVRFSGQREVAIRVEGGSLLAADCELTASISQTLGVAVGTGAEATLERCSFQGPFKRALQLDGSKGWVSGSVFEGAVVGAHALGGSLLVERSSFRGGRGPALFAAGGQLVVHHVSVHGHEYALQTGPGTRVQVEDLVSFKAERAGVALLQTSGSLSDLVVLEPGPLGGLQLLESQLRVQRLWLHSAQDCGLLVRLGTLSLEEAVILGTRAQQESSGHRSGGDAMVVRGAQVRIRDLTVSKAQGAGLIATAGAKVQLSSGVLEHCAGGLVVDSQASLKATSVLIRRSSAAAVQLSEGAWLIADLLEARENQGGPVWADCQGATRMEVFRPRGDWPGALPPCLTLHPGPQPPP